MSLPWAPYRDGSLAFPEGDNRRTRFALISPEAHPSQRWQWRVALDAERMSGTEDNQDAARVAAEAAWQRLARADWEDHATTLIYRAEAGNIGAAAFDLASTTREDLLWIMARIEKRPPSVGLTKLSDAISSELAARRGREGGAARPVR